LFQLQYSSRYGESKSKFLQKAEENQTAAKKRHTQEKPKFSKKKKSLLPETSNTG